MSGNPFIPSELGYVADSTLIQTDNDYRDVLSAISERSSHVADDLRTQIEEALQAIEAELAGRLSRIFGVVT